MKKININSLEKKYLEKDELLLMLKATQNNTYLMTSLMKNYK